MPANWPGATTSDITLPSSSSPGRRGPLRGCPAFLNHWGEDHRPPELVLGFGDLSQQAIERGIATIADLLACGDNGDDPPGRGVETAIS